MRTYVVRKYHLIFKTPMYVLISNSIQNSFRLRAVIRPKFYVSTNCTQSIGTFASDTFENIKESLKFNKLIKVYQTLDPYKNVYQNTLIKVQSYVTSSYGQNIEILIDENVENDQSLDYDIFYFGSVHTFYKIGQLSYLLTQASVRVRSMPN